jgi:hypothetical protein
MEQQSTGTAPLDTPMTTEGAAQVFESLLTRDETPPPTDGAAAPAPSEEVQETPIDEEQAQENTEDEPQEQEVEAAEEAETEAQPMVKVVVNGEEIEIPLDEAVKGYQRTADYTRKTQQLAEERKAAEATKQQAEVQRQQYEQAIAQALTLAQAFQPKEPNWDELYQNDPLEFVRQREAWRDRSEHLTRLQAEQQRLMQVRQQEQVQGLQQHIGNEVQKLTEKLPEWRDEAKAKQEKSALVEYGKSNGYSAEEMSKVYDHRAVLMMRKAMLYDQLMSKKSLVENKVRQAPKMVKPGNSTPPTSQLDESMRRLRKSGKQDDAARAFMNIL